MEKKIDIEPFKMRVSPEQSKIVQEILFKNGYKWIDGSDYVRFDDNQYLFLNDWSGCSNISSSNIESNFVSRTLEELTFADFMTRYFSFMVVKSVVNPQVTKVCIKGDGTDEYGKIIIDYLRGLGGENVDGVIGDGLVFYFIEDYCISFSGIAPKGYTEISLKAVSEELLGSTLEIQIPGLSSSLRNLLIEILGTSAYNNASIPDNVSNLCQAVKYLAEQIEGTNLSQSKLVEINQQISKIFQNDN